MAPWWGLRVRKCKGGSEVQVGCVGGWRRRRFIVRRGGGKGAALSLVNIWWPGLVSRDGFKGVNLGLMHEGSGELACSRSASVTRLGVVGALSWRRGALWKHRGGSMKSNVMMV